VRAGLPVYTPWHASPHTPACTPLHLPTCPPPTCSSHFTTPRTWFCSYLLPLHCPHTPSHRHFYQAQAPNACSQDGPTHLCLHLLRSWCLPPTWRNPSTYHTYHTGTLPLPAYLPEPCSYTSLGMPTHPPAYYPACHLLQGGRATRCLQAACLLPACLHLPPPTLPAL